MSLEEYGYRITEQSGSVPWGPTEYKILHEGSGAGTFARESSQASVSYICEYVWVERFLDTILGKTVKAGSSLRRSASVPVFDPSNGSTPESHPFWKNLWAASAEVIPLGTAATTPSDIPYWKKAQVNVMYRPVDYNIIPDYNYSEPTEINRFVSKVPDGSAEFQTSQGIFKFVSDPQHRPLEIQPGFVIASQRVVYTWKQVPVSFRPDGRPDLGRVPNIDTILGLLGQINFDTFDGYPPGTVLFSSFSPKLILPQLASENSYYWDIAYSFGIRDYGVSTTPLVPGEHIGWNYAFDPARKVWDLYTDTGTTSGNGMYAYAGEDLGSETLNDLFAVNW